MGALQIDKMEVFDHYGANVYLYSYKFILVVECSSSS